MSTYNGWTNYETWCVALWISNEQNSQALCGDFARESLKELDRSSHPSYNEEDFDGEDYGKYPPTEEEKHEATCTLADQLKELHEEANPLNGENNVYSDLLNASLSEVNWYEIAESHIEEAVR